MQQHHIDRGVVITLADQVWERVRACSLSMLAIRTIQANVFCHVCIHEEGLDDGCRRRQTRGFDDDPVEVLPPPRLRKTGLRAFACQLSVQHLWSVSLLLLICNLMHVGLDLRSCSQIAHVFCPT